MLYQAYQAQADIMTSLRGVAGIALQGFGQLRAARASPTRRRCAASTPATSCSVASASPTSDRRSASTASPSAGVRSRSTRKPPTSRPFGTLLHFAKESDGQGLAAQPKVLLVAPLSGHFATLLRGTVPHAAPRARRLDHRLAQRPRRRLRRTASFGFDGYIEHLIRWLEVLGPDTHVIAVCQPCVAALVATAVMAEAGNPATPRTLTLMAGPIDTRVDPTVVNDLATSKPISWFERNVITTVPMRYAGRRPAGVPGVPAAHLVRQHEPRTPPQRAPRAVPPPRRRRRGRGRGHARRSTTSTSRCSTSPPSSTSRRSSTCSRSTGSRGACSTSRAAGSIRRAIRRTALLTVEGERDDICSPGQTFPAHDLCRSIRPMRKRHHLQPGVGHYGVFNGRRWEQQIYPLVHNLILANS